MEDLAAQLNELAGQSDNHALMIAAANALRNASVLDAQLRRAREVPPLFLHLASDVSHHLLAKYLGVSVRRLRSGGKYLAAICGLALRSTPSRSHLHMASHNSSWLFLSRYGISKPCPAANVK